MFAQPPPAPCRILVVDDDPISLEFLAEMLRAGGHEVITATDGRQAMALLAGERVHVVIADWVMPVMDGLALCRHVKARQADTPIHFVMLTSHSDKPRLIEALDAGADDFLSKPPHEGELMSRLRAWGRLIELRDELDTRNRAAVAMACELAAANKQLAELATQDPLTGLGNRREAMRRLGELWLLARRYGDPVSAAMIDLDRFKQVNDTHGHGAGDQVLRHVAAALRDCTRTADGVFRLGGDEFLIIFPRQGATDAAVCAERCRSMIESRACAYHGKDLRVTISLGLAERCLATPEPQDLLDAADEALYVAKRKGRNGIGVGK